MFLLALQWGGTKFSWNSAIIIGFLSGAGVVLILFALWEYRVGEGAMVPFSMVKRRVVWSAGLVNLFFLGGQLITSYYLPIYFQSVKGVSPIMSGVYILPGILGQIITGTISGILGKRARIVLKYYD
jgi:predicted MFS family arabinose efflux permease